MNVLDSFKNIIGYIVIIITFVVKNIVVMLKIIVLMILLHLVDDFVFQPVCLSRFKQKTYWSGYRFSKFEKDWIAGLVCHGFEWSSMVMLPWFFVDCNEVVFILTWFVSAVIHCFVDHLKCNCEKINLITDQSIHLMQVLLMWLVMIMFL